MQGDPPASIWRPLRQSVFRNLFLANTVSNVGSWMQEVAQGWLMITLSATPLMVGLIQTMSAAPFFLLALPAGALADVLDRRRLLLCTQVWMLLAAGALAGLTLTGHITPPLLLVCVFALGIGNALNMPAWQALPADLVEPADLSAAVALGSLSFNLARAVGPALGGMVVAAVGPGQAFVVNALSFLGVIFMLHRWQRRRRPQVLPAERVLGAMQAGVRYVRHATPLHSVLIRTALFMSGASALWAMLPLVARLQLGLGSPGYGVLLGCLGLGSVVGAVLLAPLRRRLSADLLLAASTLLYATGVVVVSRSVTLTPVCLALLGCGVAWVCLLTTLNVLAQSASSPWVRARVLSLYVLVFQGCLAGGSAVWGAIAQRHGLPAALQCAAGLLTAGILVGLRYPLRSIENADMSPSRHWPVPEVATRPDMDDGPVLVTVEYRIDPARGEEFDRAMDAVRPNRQRDGAFQWSLFHDMSQPGRYLEVFLVASWVEHLRQHDRVTIADRGPEDVARSFHLGPSGPQVSHYLAGPASLRPDAPCPAPDCREP